MGKPKTDLTGMTFNRWSVLKLDRVAPPHKYYFCRCSCGTERVVQANSLVVGSSKSCGGHRREVSTALHTTHGMVGHPAYSVWTGMRRRCEDPGFASYPWYGQRGIKVCGRWHDFGLFWADMGETWAEGLSLDRIDPNGNYEPANCRWVAVKEQSVNKRNTRLIDTPWGPLAQAEAARRAGISLGALVHRMNSGWPKPRWFDPPRGQP